ncbi:uncharacterized protein [Blastocystis hominis]|uniref:Uncharacterized protein n=1 Tax=Blastocystis hominis TaxID=12968 RepID=D8LZD4_BLAHO|nr:uncharacterized protein [Blastocystis hominis]CBK21173.2 unnamed protein product [Blastocystis hominis]|eukprot:XP_012895221.1 uncharacterized protein [Blastocystis hominis]
MRLAGVGNFALQYRRYHPYISLPSVLQSVKVSEGGVLLGSTAEVNKLLEEFDQAEDEIELSNYGQALIEWRECSVTNRLFNGALYVLGEGDLYVMATKEEQEVSAYEVITFGSFIGTFDQEAVKLQVKLENSDRHRYHAVIKYKEQVFGPFSEVC